MNTDKPDAVEFLTTDKTVELIALLPDGELRYIDKVSKVNDFLTTGFTEMPSPRITTAARKALTAERDELLREPGAPASHVRLVGIAGRPAVVWLDTR